MNIAVVGTGIAGMTAAYLLARRHEITVVEAADRVGGHTNTVTVDLDGQSHPIDTGFIVFNDWTYPNFIALLEQLNVPSQRSTMSFSVRCERTGLEYNGASLNTLFAQRSNLLRPGFYRMVADILRFNRQARVLAETAAGDELLGKFLVAQKYSRQFVDHYLLPMASAIWSSDPGQTLAMPARFLIRFFNNHGLLSVSHRPTWRVITGGSKRYVESLIRPFVDRIRLRTPIVQITRHGQQVLLKTALGECIPFDGVVIATHGDQALRMLGDPSDAEREVLGAFRCQQNEAVLHTDTSLLPRRRLAWASWNYHLPAVNDGRVAVTYYMNLLQGITASRDFCVTLNRTAAVAPEKILRTIMYEHPLYTAESVRAQRRHDEINGVRRTYYCGAYWGNGFHEDGVVSALAVAAKFGLELKDSPQAQCTSEQIDYCSSSLPARKVGHA